VEGGEPIKAIDLWHTSTAAGSGVKQATGEVSIPAGYYRITTRFNLADGGVQKYAGKTEVLHIYKDLTTNAPYTFTAENFFPLNTTGTERRVVTTIFGDPTSLQGILANMPPNTRDTPYIIAIKDLKIDGTETSPTKITGTAADPLVNLFNLLNGRYVSYDLSGMTGTAIPDVSPTDTTIAARQNKDRVVSVILPSGLTSIGAYTFSGCTSLTEVVYNPGTVTSIGAFAFENCSSLASIELPAADNSVGASAFSGCTSLYAISIPSTWTTIPANAFEGTGIREITIPAAITGIGNSAFQDCASLTTVTLTNPVTAGTGLFVRCTSLSSIDLSKLVTTAIPASLFNGCSALASVDIPSSVTSIGNSAFKDCASLTSITLPSGLTALGTI
jgi:hypothetical protein